MIMMIRVTNKQAKALSTATEESTAGRQSNNPQPSTSLPPWGTGARRHCSSRLGSPPSLHLSVAPCPADTPAQCASFASQHMVTPPLGTEAPPTGSVASVPRDRERTSAAPPPRESVSPPSSSASPSTPPPSRSHAAPAPAKPPPSTARASSQTPAPAASPPPSGRGSTTRSLPSAWRGWAWRRTGPPVSPRARGAARCPPRIAARARPRRRPLCRRCRRCKTRGRGGQPRRRRRASCRRSWRREGERSEG